MKTLKDFQEFFDSEVINILEKYIDNQDIVQQIMYAINGGKRLRPVLVLSIAFKKNKDLSRCLKFAVAMEFIHTSSILLDDLPSMDNDILRRNQEAFHVKYSVLNTQIITGLLINLSIKLVYDNFIEIGLENKLDIIIQNICKNVGILGAAGGQLLDLTPFNEFDRTKLNTKQNIEKLHNMKTTSFFEMAFLGSYLLNYDGEEKDTITEASFYFGLCFQIYDDFDDIEQDKKRTDDNLFDPNYINNFGKKNATAEFHNNMNQFINKMKHMDLFTNQIQEICFMLIQKIKHYY